MARPGRSRTGPGDVASNARKALRAYAKASRLGVMQELRRSSPEAALFLDELRILLERLTNPLLGPSESAALASQAMALVSSYQAGLDRLRLELRRRDRRRLSGESAQEKCRNKCWDQFKACCEWVADGIKKNPILAVGAQSDLNACILIYIACWLGCSDEAPWIPADRIAT